MNNKSHCCTDSKVFCMFPWLHLNVTPLGNVYPCCSSPYIDPLGNIQEANLKKFFNCDRMKELRLNMLNDIPTDICTFCYEHEKAGPHSFRKYANEHFSKFYDEIVPTTQSDGTVDEFKMRYFDIRFSNICNFKCRTCGAEFSSSWAQEQKELFFPDQEVLLHADNSGILLTDVLEQVEHIDIAYFAGGEPLIMEEHYIILEEMIRRGRTDTTLRYNTNISTLKFKNYDLLDLWSNFSKIELSCSIDHYGEKAEYLRCGTNWSQTEANLKMMQQIETIDFQFNTVLSIFNYLTLPDLYEYLYEQRLISKHSWHNTLYLAPNPPEYSARNLPKMLKQTAEVNAIQFCQRHKESLAPIVNLMNQGIAFAKEDDTWSEYKEVFWRRTNELDAHRGEDLITVFPELAPLKDIE